MPETADSRDDPDAALASWRERSPSLAWSWISAVGLVFSLVAAVSALRPLDAFPPTSRPAAIANANAPDEASPAPGPAAAPRVVGFEVEVIRAGDRSRPLGKIDVTPGGAGYDEAVRVLARLDLPVYCYLISLGPDDRIRLADPLDANTPPSRTSEIRHPRDPSRVAPLSGGAGLQVWLLVASRKPLPPFSEWFPAPLFRWRSVLAEGVWRFNGRRIERFERDHWRVLDVPFDAPRPFAQLCALLGNISDVDAVEAIAFPVRPKAN